MDIDYDHIADSIESRISPKINSIKSNYFLYAVIFLIIIALITICIVYYNDNKSKSKLQSSILKIEEKK